MVAGSPYGDVSPVLDRTTGLPLLQLPRASATCHTGWTGDLMSDSVPTPSLHEGMAVIVQRGSWPWAVSDQSHFKDPHHRRHLWWWYNNINDNDHDFGGDDFDRHDFRDRFSLAAAA